jgi:hypothetical protein
MQNPPANANQETIAALTTLHLLYQESRRLISTVVSKADGISSSAEEESRLCKLEDEIVPCERFAQQNPHPASIKLLFQENKSLYDEITRLLEQIEVIETEKQERSDAFSSIMNLVEEELMKDRGGFNEERSLPRKGVQNDAADVLGKIGRRNRIREMSMRACT